MVSIAPPVSSMQPPPMPFKRPTMTLKRSSSFVVSEEAKLPSSMKKLKVAFDPNIDVRIMDDWNDKSFELVREEVRNAVERHAAGYDAAENIHYSRLLHLLGQEPSSSEAAKPKLLQKYLLAIDINIDKLGGCGKLAVAAINISWLGRSEDFVSLYLKYLCDLASTHSKYVLIIVEKLVQHFAKLPASLGRLPDEAIVSRSTMQSRLHSVIRVLLRQIPSACSAFTKAMKLHFPYDLESQKAHLQYQQNLLRVVEYAPELRYEILALIVQRMVDQDMQIQRDLEDFEDDEEDRILQRQPDSQSNNIDDVDDTDDESVSETELSVTEDEQRLRELRLRTAKLDVTLDLLFSYYAPLIEDGSHAASNEAYNQLLSHFATYILPTRSRHAQFLLFHFSQTSPEHSELFVNQCLQLAGRDSGRTSHRMTALAYISSFIARGARLSCISVQDTITVLCQTLEDIRRRYEPTCRGPERRPYGLYYAVAQALLYIFCFRWRDLVVGAASPGLEQDDFNEDDAVAEGRDLSWFPGFKETMRRNIYCRLNPLKVCSQAIVEEFAKIAHHLRFLYVFPLIETNKRIRLGQHGVYHDLSGLTDIGRRETAWDRKKGEKHHQLEAYFPFDPYHLPESKHWITNDYNEWRLPAGMKSDDVGNISESDDDDDDGSNDSVIGQDIEDYSAIETHSMSS